MLSLKFTPCGSMCDNCNSKNGIPRRGRDDEGGGDDGNEGTKKKKRKATTKGAKATFQTAAQMRNGSTKSKTKSSSVLEEKGWRQWTYRSM